MEKSHILSEIRRTAELNGGVPLGKRRFQSVTGIRESDWAGRHWLRWSEAVREAGLAPNSMVVPFDDEYLLTRLAKFVRELGHYPLQNELVMKAGADPEFPSEKTFRRLGRKGEVAARLVAWCEFADGWDDVKAMALAVATSMCPDEPTPLQAGSSQADGFVYLMKSGKHYKIGRSNSAGRRHYEVSLQLPEAVTLVHEIATDDPVGIERYWHERFAHRRRNGEWFELRREDVSAFRRRKFM